jgi:hypothetical protein
LKNFFKKMLDKRFQSVLKFSTVCEKSKRFFLEIIFVTQNWIHTRGISNGSPAPREMRFSISLSESLCAGFDNPNYQPKLGGLDRAERKI